MSPLMTSQVAADRLLSISLNHGHITACNVSSFTIYSLQTHCLLDSSYFEVLLSHEMSVMLYAAKSLIFKLLEETADTTVITSERSTDTGLFPSGQRHQLGFIASTSAEALSALNSHLHEMTCYVSSGTLNHTHTLTPALICFKFLSDRLAVSASQQGVA